MVSQNMGVSGKPGTVAGHNSNHRLCIGQKQASVIHKASQAFVADLNCLGRGHKPRCHITATAPLRSSATFDEALDTIHGVGIEFFRPIFNAPITTVSDFVGIWATYT